MIQNADPSSIVTSRAHPSRRHFRARPATSRPTHALNTSHMSLTVSLSARAAVPRAARVVRTPRGAVALARAAADASADADAVAAMSPRTHLAVRYRLAQKKMIHAFDRFLTALA